MALVHPTVHSGELRADKTKNFVGFNAIRVLATVSVIAVHVGTPVVNKSTISLSSDWWVGNLYESIFRSGIPLFLMLTGALLLPKANGLAFVKKRVVRVLLPFSFWVLIYLIVKNPINEIGFSDYLHDLRYSNSFHFWYIYLILVIYVFLPLVKYVVDTISPSTLTVFVVIILLMFSLNLFSIDDSKVVRVFDSVLYLLYIIFGYCLIKQEKPWWLKDFRIGLFLILCGILITYFGTYYLSSATGVQQEHFYKSTYLHIFLKAVGVWMIIDCISGSISASLTRVLDFLSKFSFGVYLIHPLVIDHILLLRLGISSTFLGPVIGILLTTVLCFILSTSIIYLLSKLPLGKYTY